MGLIGDIMRKSLKNERLGEERYNNQGSLMKIIEYIDSNNMLVEFQDQFKYKTKAHYCWFLTGEIKNPYAPSIYGLAFSGTKYPIKDKNGDTLKEYNTWRGMLRRCYDNEYLEKHPTYRDVKVCEEWLNYENFYEWIISQENYKKWKENKGTWDLDKDILFLNNKIYSPNTCCLIPQYINKIFVYPKNNSRELPRGIIKNGIGNYFVWCGITDNDGKSKKYLGKYKTLDEAVNKYIEYKKEYINKVAEKAYNKGDITLRCYNAMKLYDLSSTIKQNYIR